MIENFHFSWYLLLPLLGFAIGLLVTMIGGGGGIFYVPVLTLLFKIPTQYAVAASLASIIPTTILGSVSHYRSGNLNLKIGMILGLGGIGGTFLGAYLSSLISPTGLSKLFGIVMIILAIPMIFSSRKRVQTGLGSINDSNTNTYDNSNINSISDSAPANANIVVTKDKIVIATLFGLLSGMMAGMFGVSGTPPVITGLYLLGYAAPVVVGTSVFVLLFNAVSGLFGHLIVGQFDLLLIILLGTGAALGAYVGPKLLSKMRITTLEKGYAPLFISMNIIIGIIMILLG